MIGHRNEPLMTRLFVFWFCLLLLPAVCEANGISVQTDLATGIAGTSATVHGLVSGGLDTVAVTVEFGTTPALGQQQSAGTAPAGFSAVAVSAVLSGLPAGQTVYYRFTAQSASASAQGSTRTFTTLVAPVPGPPTILSATPVAVGGTFARIVARIDPHLMGTTVTANSRLSFFAQADSPISGDSPAEVELTFHGLARSQQYSYEIVATNALGTARLAGTFSTVENAPPTAGHSYGNVVRGDTVLVSLPIADEDNDPLSFSIETPPAFGTVTYLGGRIAYTAGREYRWYDFLKYVVRDAFGAEAHGTVSLTNPFLSTEGSYDAALVNRSTGKADGMLKVVIGRQGEFTGVLWNAGIRYPLRGSFRFGGRFDQRMGEPGRAIRVQLTIDRNTGAPTGTVSGITQTWSVQGGVRSGYYHFPSVRRFTTELDAPASPRNRAGHGWAVVTVSPSGVARFAGQFANGERLLASAVVRQDLSLLLPVAPSSGFAVLHIFLFATSAYDLSGDVFPFTPPTDPFTASLPRPAINGSRYSPPDITHGLLRFLDDFPPVITLKFSADTPFFPSGAQVLFGLHPNVAFVSEDGINGPFTMEMTAHTGLGVFFGRVAFPDHRVARFQGVFLQKRNVGSGLFYGVPYGKSSAVGAVELAPFAGPSASN